ncbi:biotin--[acetyl-CoA-carboxylase] ligase [Lusitaniella coriacea LEGE 07157]|uniref:Biotin--[acetyl-CoA-carboxylase] ligase n=1 Tax=Lusitaniella coriacea LEGE 07157 TaxID=945747 RepID=A0A8J7DLE8_9CYAN|nr:biotin--[acetyl-CoA-carboxylase] ligase [Lusitaniella coriacea]MBE9114923.1 biotin--[acetyl-CoA-carboxylase] ligase [Lusitaniella coriacea LEGE 07157]
MAFDRQLFTTVLQQFSQTVPKVELYTYEVIGSTNQACWEEFDRAAKIPFIAIARQQTAGRGQWGRTWHSEPGGLYLSLAIAPNIPAPHAPHLTLCSAWGIATALRRYQIPVFLKWPNDLILNGCKLGGIKSETRVHQGKIERAVIGVGINWKNPAPSPGIALFPWIQQNCANSRTDSSPPPPINSVISQQSTVEGIGTLPVPSSSLEILAAIITGGLFSGYQRYKDEGIENILSSYFELLAYRDRAIVVDGCPATIVGIEPTGALRLRLQSQGAAVEICRMPGTISLGYETPTPNIRQKNCMKQIQ